MGTGEDADVLADDLTFGGDNDALGIDPHADRSIGERGWHAVAIAVEMDQARRRDPLGVLDEAVEGPGKRHQLPPLFGPGVGHRTRLRNVRRLCPQLPAARLQPVVQRRQGGKARCWLPKPMAGVLDVLLNLPLLPTRRRIAELGLEQEVADHGGEARVDLPLLAAPDSVDGGAHVVVNPAFGNAAEHAEGVIMRVEQHLVGLLQIGAENEGAAIAELEVGDLELGSLPGDNRPVFRPVELESVAAGESQGHEDAPARGSLFALPSSLPFTGESRHPIVRTLIAQRRQIGVQLQNRPLLLARLPRLLPQHMRQFVGVWIELAWPVREVELRLRAVRAQVSADCIPRQTGASRYLPDREMVPKTPASDDAH